MATHLGQEKESQAANMQTEQAEWVPLVASRISAQGQVYDLERGQGQADKAYVRISQGKQAER